MRYLLLLFCMCFWVSGALADSANPLAVDQQKFNEGAAAYDAGDYQTAYKIFLDLADNNDIAAMRNVALMKRKGQGTEVDPKGARTYLEEAAEGGLPTAQSDLADMLLSGEGGPADPKAALPWLQSAAKAGHPMAEFHLGQLYEQGVVVEQDLTKAEQLYADAAARGVEDAGARLAAIEAGKAKAEQPPAEQPPSP